MSDNAPTLTDLRTLLDELLVTHNDAADLAPGWLQRRADRIDEALCDRFGSPASSYFGVGIWDLPGAAPGGYHGHRIVRKEHRFSAYLGTIEDTRRPLRHERTSVPHMADPDTRAERQQMGLSR